MICTAMKKNLTIKDAFLLTGLNWKQKLTVYACVISFCTLCMTIEAPVVFYIINIIVFVVSAYFCIGIPTPDYFKDNEDTSCND